MTIDLDVAHCSTVLDVGRELKAALRSPDGHGNSIDAFLDSMIWGGMNAVEPPYKIRVMNAENLPADVLDWIKLLKFHLADARQEVLREEGLNIDVEMEIMPSSKVR